MKILAIETSCDETASAVIETDPKIGILSNVVASQIALHRKFGGVFPEIASRAHAEQIIPVIKEALGDYDIQKDIDLIAVTAGPGLIGSLLVGVNSAKTLAYANNKPIVGINHWLGHIYSCFTNSNQTTGYRLQQKAEVRSLKADSLPRFPILALIVSGGHTGLVYMKSHTKYETIGQTLDDAAGEAFDKVAKILDLGYPGGPAISEAAARHKKQDTITKQIPNIKFPRSMLDREDFDFSFSGLKTSVLYKVKELEAKNHNKSLSNHYKSLIAFEFQQCVIDILIGKTLQAAEKHKPKSIILCGGVSANQELRSQMAIAIENWKLKTENSDVSFHFPEMKLCGDNAAMIGLAAAYQIANGIKPTIYNNINANSNLKL